MRETLCAAVHDHQTSKPGIDYRPHDLLELYANTRLF